MTNPIETWQLRLARKANLLVLDDENNADDAACTWFGRITLAKAGETWPTSNGRLMWPLLQIVVRELPFMPPRLADLALIRVFVDPAFLMESDDDVAVYYEPKGASTHGCLLLASPTLEGFETVSEPDHGCRINPARGRWELIEADYPEYEDLPFDISDSLLDAYPESSPETRQGTKVGGWPFYVQAGIGWALYNPHIHNPEYVFQIDSYCERGWMWGDSGFGYFGRGAGSQRDMWAMDWQCC